MSDGKVQQARADAGQPVTLPELSHRQMLHPWTAGTRGLPPYSAKTCI